MNVPRCRSACVVSPSSRKNFIPSPVRKSSIIVKVILNCENYAHHPHQLSHRLLRKSEN